jgi:hypothetical protein
MLNNPFVQAQAAKLAERLEHGATTEPDRINLLHQWLFGRPANADEQELARSLLNQWRQGSEVAKTEEWEQRVWREYCQVLFCSNEFAFID